MLTSSESAVLDPDQLRALTAALALQRKSWEQGVLGHAMLDLGLPRLAALQGRDAVQLQTPDGRLSADADADDNSVNCAATGEAVLAAGRGEALERQLDWLERDAPRAADGTLFHLAGSRQVWVHTISMVVPLLALTGRTRSAEVQLDGHRRRLFDQGSGLYRHRHDEDGAGRDAHWGTGNGWAVAGIARALRHLGPGASGPFWPDAARHATTVLDACLGRRTTAGLFHDVLDDPSTFEETNLVQLLGYTIFTGLADGLVVPVCAAPHFDRAGHSAEAQAFFLLATAAERAYRP